MKKNPAGTAAAAGPGPGSARLLASGGPWLRPRAASVHCLTGPDFSLGAVGLRTCGQVGEVVFGYERLQEFGKFSSVNLVIC